MRLMALSLAVSLLLVSCSQAPQEGAPIIRSASGEALNEREGELEMIFRELEDVKILGASTFVAFAWYDDDERRTQVQGRQISLPGEEREALERILRARGFSKTRYHKDEERLWAQGYRREGVGCIATAEKSSAGTGTTLAEEIIRLRCVKL